VRPGTCGIFVWGAVFICAVPLCTEAAGKFIKERSASGHSRGIGAGSTLKNVIVGHDACIGKNVVLVNKQRLDSFDVWDRGFVVRDGVTIVLKGAKIPDRFEF
jgi:ADP-glucose pyrophosphorylase